MTIIRFDQTRLYLLYSEDLQTPCIYYMIAKIDNPSLSLNPTSFMANDFKQIFFTTFK